MGYYSSFDLEIEGNISSSEKKAIIQKLHESFPVSEYAFDENGESQETVKWYDMKINMIEFSKDYPTLLFIVTREGEGQADVTKYWFRNGKSVCVDGVVTVTFPEVVLP